MNIINKYSSKFPPNLQNETMNIHEVALWLYEPNARVVYNYKQRVEDNATE